MTGYIHIVVLAIIAGVFSLAFLLLSRMFGPKRPTERKLSTYECGIPVEGRLLGRFSIKFYMVVILFLLFDLEVVFLYPWAIQQRSMSSWTLWIVEGALFALVLLVGWVYAMKKGVLEWGTQAGPQRD